MDSISGPAGLRHTSSSLNRGDYIIPDSVTCPICGEYTDRAESVIAHIVGSTGSHKGTGYTSARSMVERQVSEDDPEINEAEDDPEEPAAKAEDQPEVDPETSATSRASTDGGPRPPPEPDVDVDDQEDKDDDPVESVDDLPDRYVSVDEIIDELASVEHVNGDALRRRLSRFDVVDVKETTTDEVAAYRFEEIA